MCYFDVTDLRMRARRVVAGFFQEKLKHLDDGDR